MRQLLSPAFPTCSEVELVVVMPGVLGSVMRLSQTNQPAFHKIVEFPPGGPPPSGEPFLKRVQKILSPERFTSRLPEIEPDVHEGHVRPERRSIRRGEARDDR